MTSEVSKNHLIFKDSTNLWFETLLLEPTPKQQFPHYKTKKEIEQEVKRVNSEIEMYMEKNRKEKCILRDLAIEDLVLRKAYLKKRLLVKGRLPGRDDISELKKVPITTFVAFRGGFAKCLWHTERTPSMKYFKDSNTVHCFGCSINGDVVDVVQKINSCSFKEAIKILQSV